MGPNTSKVISFFGNRVSPLPKHTSPESNRFHLDKLPKWTQVHGTKVVKIDSGIHVETIECDGFYTETRNIPIAVRTADCVPILLYAIDGSACAALHAGWRGCYDEITKVFATEFVASNFRRKWKAAIGPSIRECCFEVSTDLWNQFLTKFSDQVSETGQNPQSIFCQNNKLSLQKLVHSQLTALDFDPTNIEIVNECTFCTHDESLSGSDFKYFSYRREKSTDRQFHVIELNSCLESIDPCSIK